MNECPFCRKPFIDCECKGRCVHCNQVAGSEGRADFFLSMVMSGKLIKPGKKLSAALADANEWKQQHENLLAVRQQDITALSAKIEQLESQLANTHKADSELADKLEKLLEKVHRGKLVAVHTADKKHMAFVGTNTPACTVALIGHVDPFEANDEADLYVELRNNAQEIIAALRKS